MAMLQIANKRQTELRNSLKKKVTLAIDSQRNLRGDQVENLDEMVLYGPQLNRALMGFMPKAEGTDDDEPPSSKKKSSKNLAGRESSSSSNRARRYVNSMPICSSFSLYSLYLYLTFSFIISVC